MGVFTKEKIVWKVIESVKVYRGAYVVIKDIMTIHLKMSKISTVTKYKLVQTTPRFFLVFLRYHTIFKNNLGWIFGWI